MSSETTLIKCIGGPMHGRTVEIAPGQDDHDDLYDVLSVPDGPVLSIYRPQWLPIIARILKTCDPKSAKKITKAFDEIDALCDQKTANKLKAIFARTLA